MSALVLESCIQIANFVDRIFIGQYLGGKGLAATGATLPIINVLCIIFSVFIIGGNIVCMVNKGMGDKQRADECFTFAVIGGTVLSLIICVLGIIFANPISRFLIKGEGELFQTTHDYLIPLLISVVLTIFVNGSSIFVRSEGMVKLAIIIPIVTNSVNLFCDFLFMGVFKWGISAAGWATNVGYIVGGLFLLFFYFSRTRTIHFTAFKLSHLSLLPECFEKGMISAMNQVTLLIHTIIINRLMVGALGAVGLEILSVCFSIYGVVSIFYYGIGDSMLPVGASLWGEKDYKGMRMMFRYAFQNMMIFGGLFMILFIVFPVSFAKLLGVNDEVPLNILRWSVRWYAVSLPLNGFVYLFRSWFQMVGKDYRAMSLPIAQNIIFFVPVAFLFATRHPKYIWLSYTINCVAALAFTILFEQVYARREGRKYFLDVSNRDEGKVFDFSVRNTTEDAVAASERVVDLCMENGLSMRIGNMLGIAAEELCASIAENAKEERQIDLFLKIFEDEVILKVRDNEKVKNSTVTDNTSPSELSGLEMLKKMPIELSYNRTIGFNTTLVRIPLETKVPKEEK